MEEEKVYTLETGRFEELSKTPEGKELLKALREEVHKAKLKSTQNLTQDK